MDATRPDPRIVARRLIALYGGPDRFRSNIEGQLADANARWSQDALLIGRILRSHLYVEHYLGTYLRGRNPSLGDVDSARLSFAQKVALLDSTDVTIALLIPGIRRLNQIRNRIAHELRAELTVEDRDVFLNILEFKALMTALAAPNVYDPSPVEVLEDFAKLAGSWLNSSVDPNRALWEKAISSDPIVNSDA